MIHYLKWYFIISIRFYHEYHWSGFLLVVQRISKKGRSASLQSVVLRRELKWGQGQGAGAYISVFHDCSNYEEKESERQNSTRR